MARLNLVVGPYLGVRMTIPMHLQWSSQFNMRWQYGDIGPRSLTLVRLPEFHSQSNYSEQRCV